MYKTKDIVISNCLPLLRTKSLGLPGGTRGKEPACQRRRHKRLLMSSVPVSRRSPGGEGGYPLQYTCPENPMDRGAWSARVRGVTKSRTRLKQLTMQEPCWCSHSDVNLDHGFNQKLCQNYVGRMKAGKLGAGDIGEL